MTTELPTRLHPLVSERDDHVIGDPGPITKRLQELFFACTEGRHPRSEQWLDYVGAPAGAGAQ